MIAALLDRTGCLRGVHIHGTKTTRMERPVVAIDGELYVVIDLEEGED